MTHHDIKQFPLLPLRQGNPLPGTVTPVPVGRPRTRALADDVAVGELVVVAVQYRAEVDEPAIADLHPVGVLAEVRDKRVSNSRGAVILLEAKERVALVDMRRKAGYWEVDTRAVVETHGDSDKARALADSLRGYLDDIADDATVKEIVTGTQEPGLLADRVAYAIDIPREHKLEILRSLDIEQRLERVAELLQQAQAQAELREKIDSRVRKGLGEQQREAMLRQQLRAIQNELGEGDESGDDVARLRERLDEAELPDEVRKVADREFRRLVAMQGGQGESHVIRNYLEWLVELPWENRAETKDDIAAIEAALDADHHGLDQVKRRILEHMAVLKLSKRARGTILALAGPPGVGKTSLAQSIAAATGRPLARVSLGGVRDEAEVRGHRRTYVGALPGRIIGALRKVGAKNPVMVLDEIDKLGRGWAGDPEAALLELLDPEQNISFTDHYLDLPFDMSEVLFIATANDISRLSPPLRDRLEIIEINGYTVAEKVEIGKDHLWPKQLEDHGLDDAQVGLDDRVIETVVKDYTREAGVRQLGRELAKICRTVALEVARSQSDSYEVEVDGLRKILGRPKFFNEMAEREQLPGVAAGLAWTPVGGDVLYVETTQMPGKGKIEITGQLGDVMSESARAALAYLRSHADEVGVDPHFLRDHDLHIHVPAGAVPKDGPSAGVTMFTALASLVSGRAVRADTAMTGEATLRGRVLPVGGIKSKLLAAHRAGFTRVILPKRNEADIEDVPQTVRDSLDLIFAEDMAQVLDEALAFREAPGPQRTKHAGDVESPSVEASVAA